MKNTVKYALVILAAILAILLIWYFRSIFVYICLSAVISLVTRPLVSLFIKKLRVGNGLAAFFTVLLAWVIIFWVFRFIIPLVANEFRYLSTINTSSIVDSAVKLLHQVIDPFKEKSPDLYIMIMNQVKDAVFTIFNISQVKDIFSSMVSFFGGMFISAFSITFITFFFLKERGLLMKGMLLFIPAKYEEGLRRMLESIKRLLRRYFVGILIQTVLVATLVTAGFSIIGVSFNHAAAIGVMCGLLNVIPYVGPLIGAILGLLIGSIIYLQTPLEMGFLFYLLSVCIVYATVNLIDNIVFQPLIFSNSVMAHPLEIFIVILMAGYAAGIAGMFLAIPVYTILRVIAREFFSQYKIVRKITERM